MSKTLHTLSEIMEKISYLKAEISKLESVVSGVVLKQAEKISELESWVDPYSDSGEAICNFWNTNREGNYDC